MFASIFFFIFLFFIFFFTLILQIFFTFIFYYFFSKTRNNYFSLILYCIWRHQLNVERLLCRSISKIHKNSKQVLLHTYIDHNQTSSSSSSSCNASIYIYNVHKLVNLSDFYVNVKSYNDKKKDIFIWIHYKHRNPFTKMVKENAAGVAKYLAFVIKAAESERGKLTSEVVALFTYIC